MTAATAVPFFDVQGDHDSRVYPFLSAFTSRYLAHLGVHLEVLLRGRTGWRVTKWSLAAKTVPLTQLHHPGHLVVVCLSAVVPGGGHVPWTDEIRRCVARDSNSGHQLLTTR